MKWASEAEWERFTRSLTSALLRLIFLVLVFCFFGYWNQNGLLISCRGW